MTSVANIRHFIRNSNGSVTLPSDHIYIGRRVRSYHLECSPWANPFKGPQAIQEFQSWVSTQEDLIQRARKELTGKVLVCWCLPKDRMKAKENFVCHGQVWEKILDEQG